MLQSFLSELRHRWKIVLILAVLASSALITERVFLTDSVTKSTSLYVEQQVHLKYDGQPPQNTSYQNLFTSYGTLIAFLRQTEGYIDYEKFQPGWKQMLDENKAKWAKKHFAVDTVSPDVIALRFYVGENEWKDPAYAKSHALDVMKAYVFYNETMLKNLEAPVTFKLNDPVIVYPESVPVSITELCLKYGIIGFVLGTLAGLMWVLVLTLKNRNHFLLGDSLQEGTIH